MGSDGILLLMVMVMSDYLTTRQAAAYLGISDVALLRKRGLLGAVPDRRGWLRWPRERLEEYKRAVAGKALTDPTRGRELAR